MDKESSIPLEKALEHSQAKGNPRLTNALLEALEDVKRDIKRTKAA